MRREQDGIPPRRPIAQDLQHLRAHPWIEGVRDLVGEKEPRAHREDSGEGGPGFFAAAERVRRAVKEFGQPAERGDFGDTPAR